MSKGKQQSTLKGLFTGMLAGVAASAAMDGYWAVAGSMPGDRPEQKPKGPDSGQIKHEPATQIIADQVSKLLTGRVVPDDDKAAAGVAVHYGTGIVCGALFGIVAARRPRTGVPAGLLYGIAIWLLLDELMLRAIDVAPDAQKVPASQHFEALGAHLVFGSTLALTTRLLLR